MLKKGVERGQVLRALGEVFRAHGYEGASLTLITEATGLGKGSLYHLFPGGKEQMAAEVLADIDAWFELNIYAPLREASDPARAIAAMIAGVDQYFHSGDRVCLVGLVALGGRATRLPKRSTIILRAGRSRWRSCCGDPD